MRVEFGSRSWRWTTAALLLLAVAGCQSAKKCQDIPPGAIPVPAGTHLNELNGRQAMKAEADDFVIYQYEWDRDTSELDATGRRHVAMIAHRLQDSPCGVIIETQNNTELDEARRQTVVATLAGRGIEDADARVQVNYPSAEPMYGVVAPLVAAGYLRSSAGTSQGGGGGGGGGMGGGIGGISGGGGGMGGMSGGMGGGMGGMGGGMF